MPTGPRQRRISVHILGIDDCAGIKQELNDETFAERRVQRGLPTVGPRMVHVRAIRRSQAETESH